MPEPVREDAEWLWGRGVCDAKGIAAAMISAAERLAAEGERRIGLLFGVGVYPWLLVLGWVYVRRAEDNERDFTDLVDDGPGARSGG